MPESHKTLHNVDKPQNTYNIEYVDKPNAIYAKDIAEALEIWFDSHSQYEGALLVNFDTLQERTVFVVKETKPDGTKRTVYLTEPDF